MTFTTVDEYIAHLPIDRQEPIFKLHEIISTNLPEGFEEVFADDMIHFVVPHKIYPAGYHCNPSQPLPFISLASKKNHIALYHMGIYADQQLLKWFEGTYKEVAKYKLDMGKSCIRFKRMDDIPYDLIGALAQKMTVGDWLTLYEQSRQ